MSFANIRTHVEEDIRAVEALILERCHADVALVNEVTEHIMRMGGKRIRPMLVCLMAQACRVKDVDRQHLLAAIVEMIHAATLLHDDVIDHAEDRRNQPTANVVWGNQASILAGDYIYAVSFNMMTELRDQAILEVLAGATSVIVRGELLQLEQHRNVEMSMDVYEAIIYAKTAKLFEVCCQVGAMVAGATQVNIEAAAEYGRQLGMAYQLIDDTLDYFDREGALGKQVGNDLAEGRMTLPLLLLRDRATERERRSIAAMLAHTEDIDWPLINSWLQKYRIHGLCRDKVSACLQQASRCLSGLADTVQSRALTELISVLQQRAA